MKKEYPLLSEPSMKYSKLPKQKTKLVRSEIIKNSDHKKLKPPLYNGSMAPNANLLGFHSLSSSICVTSISPLKLSASRNISNKNFFDKIDVAEVLGPTYRQKRHSNSFINKLRLNKSTPVKKKINKIVVSSRKLMIRNKNNLTRERSSLSINNKHSKNQKKIGKRHKGAYFTSDKELINIYNEEKAVTEKEAMSSSFKDISIDSAMPEISSYNYDRAGIESAFLSNLSKRSIYTEEFVSEETTKFMS